jgi:hypothetical protein
MKARVLGFALACLALIVFLAPQTAVWAAAPTQRIAEGSEATCVLDSSGALHCYGYIVGSIPTDTFTQIDGEEKTFCGVKTDQSLACWGVTNGMTNIPTGAFTRVTAGATFACAMRTDGRPVCWGSNLVGQIVVPSGTFTQVEAAYQHACGLKTDGSVVCWGDDVGGNTSSAAGPFVEIRVSDMVNCGLTSAGAISCWGLNTFHNVVSQAGPFEQMSVGVAATCGIKSNGDISCWGNNLATSPAGPFAQVGIGNAHICGLRTDGSLDCWGSNTYGLAPRVAMAAPPDGEVGQSYTHNLAASGGTLPYTYTVVNGSLPAGVSLSAGELSGTPSTAGSYTFMIAVVDSSASIPLERREQYTVEINSKPVLGAIGDKSVSEGSALTFTVSASDPNPDQTLTYTMQAGAPSGVSLNSVTGAFNWTPTEAQGPGDYPITITVTDSGSTPLSDSETFTIHVSEVNSPPRIQLTRFIAKNELTTLDLIPTYSDDDLPANTLTFSLGEGAPAGASINAATGEFIWTPTEAQGPNSYTFAFIISDGAGGSYSYYPTITIYEVNQAPVLAGIGDKSVAEGSRLTFIASATDADLPANRLSFSLGVGAPAGVSINASTGEFTWTPTEAQGPGEYEITVIVSDDNLIDAKSDQETIRVTVAEVDQAPVLAGIGNQSVDEGETLAFTASAADADLPANTLTFSLEDGAPAGASINAGTGEFTWIPTEADGPGTYDIRIRVADSDGGNDSETIRVTVAEVNQNPVLDPISNQSGLLGQTLAFTATAVDTDLPANTLTFALEDDAPAGAMINGATGEFTWMPSAELAPGVYSFTVSVSDGAGGSDSQTVLVSLNASLNHIYLPLVVK